MVNQTDRQEEMIAQEAADAGEITASELGAQMMPQESSAQEQAQMDAQEARMDEIREGLSELFEDGWSAQELTAFSGDPIAREAIAKGHSVARAACAHLRAKAAMRKGGVPTARTIATGETIRDNPIEHMSDEQFDAFSRRARAAMMAGQKVRI